jgi:hypothetical protein
VTCHEGLGYYGITLDKVQCKIHGKNDITLGCFTMHGDVENWSSGSPGDHGFSAIKMCEEGKPIEKIIEQAIQHMQLPQIPNETHINCRHKRWGKSFELLFEISTLLALTYGHEKIAILH